MGKSRNKSRGSHYAKQHHGVAQRNIGDRSGSAERGGVCGPADGDNGRVIAMPTRGVAAPVSGGDDNGLPERECDVRSLDVDGNGLSGGAAPSLKRSFDPIEINFLANHIDIFPHIKAPNTDYIDVSPLLEDPRNVFLVAEGGFVSFMWQAPGIYDVHLGFKKGRRGPYAARATRDATKWLFVNTDCMVIWAHVPETTRLIASFCKAMGGEREFYRPAVWPTEDGPVGMSFWRLTYERWLNLTPSLIKEGEDFLNKIGANAVEEFAKPRVGAAIEMIYANQPEKAAILYNTWARFALLPGISLIARNPLIMQFENAVLQFLPEKEIKIIRKVGE
jgi:hypothetical protein